MQMQLAQNIKCAPPPKQLMGMPMSKFDMLLTDDETDDESKNLPGRPVVPEWSSRKYDDGGEKNK